MDEQQQASEHDERPQGEPAPSAWEWMVAGIGGLLVAGTLVFLVSDALRAGNGPPDPVPELAGIDAQQGRFHVRVRVHNRGPSAASRLRLAGTLRDGERVIEEAETEFEHLAAGSSREAGLFFANDPARAQLQLSVRSYQKP